MTLELNLNSNQDYFTINICCFSANKLPDLVTFLCSLIVTNYVVTATMNAEIANLRDERDRGSTAFMPLQRRRLLLAFVNSYSVNHLKIHYTAFSLTKKTFRMSNGFCRFRS